MDSSTDKDKREPRQSQAPFSAEVPELLQSHLEHLKASGISIDVIQEREYKSVLGKKRLADLGFSKAQQRHPGILIPLHGVDGTVVGYQYRPDHPRLNAKGKPIKYENATGSSVHLDVPSRCRPKLGNPKVPIFFPEGVKKADSLASQDVCAAGLNGVWGFKGRNPLGGTTILNDFDYITLKERDSYVVYDSDYATIPQVRQAQDRLAEHLKRKGGKVKVIYLPSKPDGSKQGADDFLAAGHTVDELIALAAEAEIEPAVRHRGYILEDKDGKPIKLDLVQLVSDLLKDYYFATFVDTHEILIYRNGVWKPRGQEFIERECQRRVPDTELLTKYKVNEVIGHIQRSTYCDRSMFNREKWVLNLENGLLDVHTKELKPYTPKLFSTIRIPLTYDPQADCPRIKQFFGEVLEPQDIPLIEELAGYSLIPDYSIQRAFLLIGDGSNGKSTLLILLRTFIGRDNCSSVPWRALEYGRFASSRLDGQLLNIYADLPSRSMNSTGSFKMLTGGDAINAEKKFKDGYSFVNFARLVFSANKPPRIEDEDSYAFWRRWIILNFPNQFPESDPKTDSNILEKLTTKSELSGLLNLALDGLERLLTHSKFSYQKTVDQTQSYYLRASDPVYAFVEDCCELNFEAVTSKDILFEAFRDYCKTNKTPLINRDSFHKTLKNSPYYRVTLTRPIVDGERVQSWKGIKVVNPVNPVNPAGGTFSAMEGEDKDIVNKGVVNIDIEKKADRSDRVDQKRDIWGGMPDHPKEPCHACGGSDFWPDFKGKRFICSRCHPKPQEIDMEV